MHVGVAGLWHLGCVTAACLSHGGHDVVALDPDPTIVGGLSDGKPPLFEPGLEDLIRQGLASGKLRIENDIASAANVEVMWVTFDTPVDENDEPQPAVVIDYVRSLIDHVSPGCLILISSQLPARTTRRLCQGGGAARTIRRDVRL